MRARRSTLQRPLRPKDARRGPLGLARNQTLSTLPSGGKCSRWPCSSTGVCTWEILHDATGCRCAQGFITRRPRVARRVEPVAPFLHARDRPVGLSRRSMPSLTTGRRGSLFTLSLSLDATAKYFISIVLYCTRTEMLDGAVRVLTRQGQPTDRGEETGWSACYI